MTCRQIVAAVCLASLQSCLHPTPRPQPVACPSDNGRDAASDASTNKRIKIDNPPPARVVKPPYTVVVDGEVVAVVRAAADTTKESSALKSVDLETVKSIAILRGAAATEQYPTAVGDVLSITRCY